MGAAAEGTAGMNKQREPWRRGEPHNESDMELPAGKTCGDCRHFRRCNAMFGHIAEDEVCDWSPSRYAETKPLPKGPQ